MPPQTSPCMNTPWRKQTFLAQICRNPAPHFWPLFFVFYSLTAFRRLSQSFFSPFYFIDFHCLLKAFSFPLFSNCPPADWRGPSQAGLPSYRYIRSEESTVYTPLWAENYIRFEWNPGRTCCHCRQKNSLLWLSMCKKIDRPTFIFLGWSPENACDSGG